LALKSAAQDAPLTAKPLSVTEQQQAWDALVSVVPEVLAQCSGITIQTDQKETLLTLKLWDFFNGREICVSVDKVCGYNLSIRAEEIRWMETQLPLDLLFLKLLALDYTPEEFRTLAG
jgi:hypothetical protein